MANLKRYNCGKAPGGVLFVESLDGEWVKIADVKESLKPLANSAVDAIALLERCKLAIREGSLHKDICEFIERQQHQ